MITSVDKVKILQYLKKHASGDLYYDDFKRLSIVKNVMIMIY